MVSDLPAGGSAGLPALRERNLIVNSLGRKWEFTFTTLVTFGGAFFASFPLFYSTSFGGACYVWFAILLAFVIQAVAYEFRRKPANVFGERTFNIFLLVNGFAGPLLLGTAVGTLFCGAPFTVDRLNMADAGGDTAISQWTTPWHGLEAIASPALLLGFSVALLAMLLGCHYLLHDIDDDTLHERARRFAGRGIVPFLLFFLLWLGLLLAGDGFADRAAEGLSGLPLRHPVQRSGHGADRAGASAAGRVERHRLLPLAGRSAVVAHDPQLLVEPLHAAGDERSLPADPLHPRLHRLRLAGHQQPAHHLGGDRGRGTQLLIETHEKAPISSDRGFFVQQRVTR